MLGAADAKVNQSVWVVQLSESCSNSLEVHCYHMLTSEGKFSGVLSATNMEVYGRMDFFRLSGFPYVFGGSWFTERTRNKYYVLWKKL